MAAPVDQVPGAVCVLGVASSGAEELNAEADNLVRLLDVLEDALDSRTLSDRVAARIGPASGSEP